MNTGFSLALSFVSLLSIGAERDPQKATGARTYTVELSAPDHGTRAMAIRARASARPADDLIAALKAIRPGDSLTISVGDDATGERHAVVAVVSGVAGYREPDGVEPIAIKDAGTAWELVELDREARKITVLDDKGQRQVFLVDDAALLSIPDVQPGQRVMLSYRFGKDGKPEAVIRLAPARVQGSRETRWW